MEPSKNALYYGDNLDILRRYIADESVDLVYLDPPFNSNANYNVLFAEKDGSRAASQIQAFEDTWTWDQEDENVYADLMARCDKVSKCVEAFRTFLGACDMLAYLVMMAPRLVELRRVMKPTASIYLHCDPTASHYLKMLMDAVFGANCFRSEVVWKRSGAHSDTKQGRKIHGHIHDTILFFTKGDDWKWNPQFTPYEDNYVGRDYGLVEEGTGRRFRRDNLTAARPGGDTSYEWRVKKHVGVRERWIADINDDYLKPVDGWEYKGVPPYNGRFWAYSKENMKQFAREGRLRHTFDGMPEFKRYLDEMPGVPLQDIWTDITPIISGTSERLGYQTQKPVALLERIIQASSNPGDVVLDPFCGCGTTVDAAQKLGRRWIGIDITHLAINLMRNRLKDSYGSEAKFDVVGEPTSLPDAEALAASNPYQFQYWALGLVGARPAEQKKGADHGIDGKLVFHEKVGEFRTVLFSVKAGNTSVAHVRDLRGVVEREKAAIGVLVTMQQPTKPMLVEATGAGFYESAVWGKKYPRIQILTVEQLLDKRAVDMPPIRQVQATFKKAAGAKDRAKTGELGL